MTVGKKWATVFFAVVLSLGPGEVVLFAAPTCQRQEDIQLQPLASGIRQVVSAAVTAIVFVVAVLVFIITVILAFLGIVALVKRLTPPQTPTPQPQTAQPQTAPTPAPKPDPSAPKTRIEAESIVTRNELIDDYRERDRRIVACLDHNEHIERYIFTHVAGVTFQNLDGSSRQVALCHCDPMQLIILKWERENPVSKTAMAVFIADGEQLGYLDARLGRETFNRIRKGEIWSGFIASIGIPSGRDDNILGATIVLVKLRKPTPSEKPWDNSVWMKPH